MSFLAPLYLLAGLAIAGPILFHLIRRTPRGRQVFSSVMFLQPSPPRLTKRSRIEDWLILLLRGLALLLLALAFARPYLRTPATTAAKHATGRQLVLLIDTSASMRRGTLWTQAKERVINLLQDLKPEDTLTVMRFDRLRSPLITADEWNQLLPADRSAAVRDRLEQTSPSWEGTNLSTALIEAAEQLDLDTMSHHAAREVILVSDLQRGSGWEELQGYTWPEAVHLRLEPVGLADAPTNVAVQVVEDQHASDDVVRVRVSNAADSTETLFLLSWAKEFADLPAVQNEQATTTLPVYVPAGQSRVLRAPERDAAARVHRLLLTGDDHEFDNTCYIARQATWTAQIVWCGEPGATEASPRFFLEPLFPETAGRKVTLVDWSAETPPELPEQAALILCGTTLSETQSNWVRHQLQRGSSVLYLAREAQQSAGIYTLLELPPGEVVEGTATDYFMLGQVDFTHPLMQPFDDPRFSDFTKLRFWKRREFTGLNTTDAEVILEFEDHVPALVQWQRGRGHLFLLASSWTRTDSELALWSKFPPLMNSLLEQGRPPALTQLQYAVGDTLDLGTVLAGNVSEYYLQQGSEEPRRMDRNATVQFNRPGLIKLAATQEELAASPLELAVNLVPEESDTTRLTRDVFEAADIQLDHRLGQQAPLDPNQERQLLNAELESQQQWWRWLLVVVLVLLLAETLLSSRNKEPQPAMT